MPIAASGLSAGYYGARDVGYGHVDFQEEEGAPIPDPIEVINAIIPPEGEIGAPRAEPAVVVVQPIELPPEIKPPVPDMTPPTIVPPSAQGDDLAPPAITVKPPGSSIVSGALAISVGTMMIYYGKRLLITLAIGAADIAKEELAMLKGGLALGSRRARGVSVRTHTGKSKGKGTLSGNFLWQPTTAEFAWWES